MCFCRAIRFTSFAPASSGGGPATTASMFATLRCGRFESPLTLLFAADFVDIFEVRGTKRQRRGTMLPARVAASAVELSYRGLDESVRRTQIRFSQPPSEVNESSAVYDIEVPSQGDLVAVHRHYL